MATSDSRIYTGPWINWSQGAVVGATITLSATSGAILTALVATFLTVVSAQAWKIAAFIWHQCISGQEIASGLHHQRRIILRNSNTPAGATWEFIQQAYYWKRRAQYQVSKSLPWVLPAGLFVICAPILSIFGASGITNPAGDRRIITSPRCGFWDTVVNNTDGILQQNNFEAKLVRDTREAQAHAVICYDQTSSGLGCNIYAQRSLQWVANTNASCPFESTMCSTSIGSMPYEMDTGPMDSHYILGINASPEDRVTVRKATTCSLLKEDGFTSNRSADSGLFIEWFYGQTGNVNSTFQYNTSTIGSSMAYNVISLRASPESQGSWHPIAQLNRSDADIDIISIQTNAVLYNYEVDDPVFSAHLVYTTLSTGQTLYTSDYWATNIGCATQYQLCNSRTSSCTQLNSHRKTFGSSALAKLDLSADQTAIVGLIAVNMLLSTPTGIIGGRSGAALQATETLANGVQGYLPSNQTQIELSGWFSAGLVYLQQGLQQFAIGSPKNYDGWTNIRPEPGSADARLCTRQTTNASAGTVSFSVLGLSIILIAGTVLIFISLFLDTIVPMIQKQFNKHDSRRLWWLLDDKVQLQRMLFEKLNMGVWNGITNSIPTSTDGQVFGGLSGKEANNPTIGPNGGTESPQQSEFVSKDGVRYLSVHESSS